MRSDIRSKFLISSLFCLFISISNSQITIENKISSSCGPPYASETLDINNIETKIFTGGDMHWDLFGNGSPYYQFPKGSNKNSSGASAIWIGGLDGGGQLKVAAQTYRLNGYDFWPGILDIYNSSTSWETCYKYDRIWKLDYKQINNFIGNYNAGNVAIGTYTPIDEILSWPGNDTIDFNNVIQAPIHDKNSDGFYKPLVNGDFPKIMGDQQLYYIMNDRGDIHTASGGQSIGLEIQLSAYAYGCIKTLELFPELT